MPLKKRGSGPSLTISYHRVAARDLESVMQFLNRRRGGAQRHGRASPVAIKAEVCKKCLRVDFMAVAFRRQIQKGRTKPKLTGRNVPVNVTPQPSKPAGWLLALDPDVRTSLTVVKGLDTVSYLIVTGSPEAPLDSEVSICQKRCNLIGWRSV